MSTNVKRVWGGIGGIDTDSDDEVEIDISATLTSDALDISYTEHVSKRQKQHHDCRTGWNHFGPTVEAEEHEEPTRKQVCHPPAIVIAANYQLL